MEQNFLGNYPLQTGDRIRLSEREPCYQPLIVKRKRGRAKYD